ncbi:MAG: acyl-CoA dehydrogenase family protein [Rhodospirillaceae bacterium]|nr:acyl-CoA dehydrogenase family protein [Rhodospirillaceae bacterium]
MATAQSIASRKNVKAKMPSLKVPAKAAKVDARGPTGKLTYDQLMANAQALLPALTKRAGKTEEMRKLPKETMADLYEAGLLRIITPARYGGLEMDWPALPEAARIVARACPSTAWIVAVVGGHSGICGRFPKALQDEVFEKGPNQLFVTASAQTTGKIVKANGGVRAHGIWRFASGCDHADWAMVNGDVVNEDGSKTGRAVRIIVPAKMIEIVDTWHVAGMKGTGSKDINYNNVFIPERWIVDGPGNFQANPPGAAVNPDCYLYDVAFGAYFSSWLLGPVLGAAEGAYESYREATKTRVGAMMPNAPAQMHTVQERLAESYCELDAARVLYDDHNRFLHERGLARRNIQPDEFIDSGRQRTYIARLCLNLVHRLVRQMGAIGIYDTNPVQRFYRDLNVMQNQVALNWDIHMLNFGRRQLGLKTGMDRLDNPPPERQPWGAMHGKAKKLNGGR